MTRWLLLLTAGLTACTAQMLDENGNVTTRNACQDDSECGGGPCEQGLCVARHADLQALLLEVTPPATSGQEYASVRYLKRLTDLPTSGAGEDFDLELDVVSEVTGPLTAQRSEAQSSCEFSFLDRGTGESLTPGTDDTIPGSVTFIPADRWPGLPTTAYTTNTSVDSGGRYEFKLRLTPGDYDVYVVPQSQRESACAVPPQILRGQGIAAGAVNLPVALPEPQQLLLQILLPATDGTLEGWRVDMVDARSGLVLSTSRVLDAEPVSLADHLVYETELFYSSVWSLDDNSFEGVGEEVVRLRPPEGVLAPTVFAERASLELFQPGRAMIELDALPSLVTVEGRVELKDSDVAVAGHVQFVAQTSPGLLTSFVAEKDVDDTGNYSVSLLPGRYTVRVVPELTACCLSRDPSCACPAPTELDFWVNTRSFQAGRTVEVLGSTALQVAIRSPIRSLPVSGATVQATPTPNGTRTLDELLRGSSNSGVFTSDSEKDGGLLLRVPTGEFTFSVIPPEASGFAWRVDTDLRVGSTEEPLPELLDVGQIQVGLPVVYRGLVLVPSADSENRDGWVELPKALIRAYAFLGEDRRPVSDPDAAVSVVQVAEARAAEDGSFELLVPSTLE